MIRKTATLLFAAAILPTAQSFAGEKALDFWDEGPRLFNTAAAGLDITPPSAQRPNGAFGMDHADKKAGDFSVVCDMSKTRNAGVIGFTSSLWGQTWQLDKNSVLHFHYKIKASEIPGSWQIELVDSAGRKLTATESITGKDSWAEIHLPLKSLDADDSFDYGEIQLCQFRVTLADEARVWFDGVHFTKAGKQIGVTDKTLTQRMDEARSTRQARITEALEASAKNDTFGGPWSSYFASLYLNKNVEETNTKLLAGLDEHRRKDPWSLHMTPYLCRLYYFFSSKAEKFPGRLTPEVEKLLLEVLWDRTYEKNDIHWAKQSTWWMDGSENHDINAKVCNLVSARIFMNEPEYKDRIYPDYGYGGGLHYGSPGYYGKKLKDRKIGGRASLSDGKEYNAEDHYYAWRDFLKEYFTERAKKGFFVERSSPGYMKHTLNFVDLAYVCGGDKELTQIVKQFKDLAYADWAQEQISGSRGGIKVRSHGYVGDGAMRNYASFYLGGPGNGLHWWYWSLVNEYELPELVSRMILDRNGLGSYEYISRGVGEEENVWPRPLGTERTMLCDTESRFVKYSYVTPDYILSTQMEHPAAMHCHLSSCGRWQGMIFAQSPECRIVTIGTKQGPDMWGREKKIDTEMVYRSVQSKSVMITQQARRWFQINPDWYGDYQGVYEKPMGVYMGEGWDRKVEQSGWIFVESGNAYAAVRVVLWDQAWEKARKAKREGVAKYFNHADDGKTVKIKEDTYTWARDNTVIVLEDKFSPVIIEGGQKEDYPTLEAFMEDILDNDIKLYQNVVPGYNTLVYTGCGEEAEEMVFNAGTTEIPTIGGAYIDYAYPMAFESPYMSSAYKSGKIALKLDGDELNLDFSTKPWWAFWR